MSSTQHNPGLPVVNQTSSMAPIQQLQNREKLQIPDSSLCATENLAQSSLSFRHLWLADIEKLELFGGEAKRGSAGPFYR